MNEFFQRKREITLIKQYLREKEIPSDDNDKKIFKLFKSLISSLQQENSFIKSELTKNKI